MYANFCWSHNCCCYCCCSFFFHSLQIVSFLEEIAGGLLGDIPVELGKIETSNGMHNKVHQPE